jgi:hypothetical protein
MLVAIIDQTTPSGQVAIKQVREAVDEATAVTEYVNSYSPPKTATDWLGHDTGWTEVQKPSKGMRWAYDFDSPPPGAGGLIEIDAVNLIMVCAALSFDDGNDIIITSDGSWQTLRRYVIAPDAICMDVTRFIMRPRFSYRSTGGTPKLRITENGSTFGNEKTLTDETGWARESFRVGGVPSNGTNTYAIQGDMGGATQFELRGLTIELAKRVD